MRYVDEFRSPAAVLRLIEGIKGLPRGARLMEVCGTHTMAISKAGLRPLLSPRVELISGPGCPVCVTSGADIDRAIAVSRLPGVTVATFGDMMKVPGSAGSLADASAGGASVKVVYSPLEALDIAVERAGEKVVFLGVGFETTAPTVAATVMRARENGVDNFFVLCFCKLVPPALRVLASLNDFDVDGIILPGHVSAVIGSEAYAFLPDEFGIPCVVAGFETADVVGAIKRLIEMMDEGPAVEIGYSRAVRPGGNPKALSVMNEVFEPSAAVWRGLLEIDGSGLELREEYRDMDASTWEVELPEPAGERGCRCGDVLCGRIRPTECALFSVACTPDNPVGPCMVSTEGTCASYYLYEREGGSVG